MLKDLKELFRNIDFTAIPEKGMNEKISGISYNSKNIQSGFLFFALQGFSQDGRAYINDAIARGAKAIVTDYEFNQKVPVLHIKVNNPRKILGIVSNRYYDEPARKLEIVGITGTNGKTTTSYLIKSIFTRANLKCGLIGTIYYDLGREEITAKNTTPESLDLFLLFSKMVTNGITHVVMEISSHGLALNRVDEIPLAVGVFTNLTRDHLDFHKTFAEYRNAKLRLLNLIRTDGTVVYNLEDLLAQDIKSLYQGHRLGYRLEGEPQNNNDSIIQASIESITGQGIKFTIHYKGNNYHIDSALLGRHNIYNILAAFGVGIAFDIDPEIIGAGIGALKSVPGRLTPVPNDKGLSVFIDYAHTEDALKHVISAVREFTRRKVIVVFGCGGNRDRGKRPLMGRIATELADFVLITSDNPRDEDPASIIKEIVQGIKSNNYQIIIDRAEAITTAIKMAQPGDSVIIAGKGHESYQIVKDEIRHFDDFEVAQKCLS